MVLGWQSRNCFPADFAPVIHSALPWKSGGNGETHCERIPGRILRTACADSRYVLAHDAQSLVEEAVSVAASFAYTIQTRDSLLDLLFVGLQAFCFTSGRGVGQAEQMLEILACVQICQDKKFSSLQQLVLEHVAAVSGCICILLAWDQERKDFVQRLKISGTPVKVFVVAPAGSKDSFELGPMADEPENFHVLEIDKIAQTLGAL